MLHTRGALHKYYRMIHSTLLLTQSKLSTETQKENDFNTKRTRGTTAGRQCNGL